MQTTQYQEARSLNDQILQRNLLRFIKGQTDFITYADVSKMLNMPQRVIRLAIRDLRRQGYPICSESGKGIVWPTSREQVMATISELRSRARDLHETANALERGMQNEFGSQEALF